MGKLRHSAPDWCLFPKDIDPREYYCRLRELGFEAVEMVAPARRPLARQAGLEILNLSAPGMQRGLNDPANHPGLLAQIRQMIDEAQREGIAQIIVFSGNRYGQSDAEGLEAVAAGLAHLVHDARQAKVTLCFEMLCESDHPGYEADSSQYGFEVVRRVGADVVKVLYDVYHMHRMKQDVRGDLTGHLGEVAHIHVAGAPGRDCLSPGGAIDYATLIPAVHAAGYRGYWGHEYRPVGNVFEELAASVRYMESLVP